MEHNKTVVYLLIILVAFTVYAISSVQYSGYGVRVGSEYGQPTAFTQTTRQSPTTGFSSYCGDGNCTGNETCANCPTDCGPCGPTKISPSGKQGLPMVDKGVFVTAEYLTPGYTFIGISGADSKCNFLASNASLGGQWVAWMSSSINGTNGTNITIHAKDRIGNYRYVLLNGKTIANSKADLLDGNIQNPINVDEYKKNVVYGFPNVLTGTLPQGTVALDTCKGWTSSSPTNNGVIGSISYTNSGWTYTNNVPCSYYGHLYCFEK